ncbi:MAG: PBSX family phage terminase large subunit [Bacteroidota bacterium]
MSFVYTTAIGKLRKLSKRIKIVRGGTSAGKTFGVLPILIDRATKQAGLEISVVAETVPHLRRGAMKDFIKIMQSTNRFIDANWNRSLLTYRFSNGSFIEFFSAEQPDKLRGARRNILYINECNNVDFESYSQLAIRTSDEIWLDYNPVAEFWVDTELMKDPDAELIVLTYKDNEALSDSIVREIEKARDKAPTSDYWSNWWKVYGLGEVGTLQGVVYEDWKQCDTIPEDAKLVSHGMDFGFTNDPTTLIAVYKSDGKLWVRELLYRTNMTNNDIGNYLKSLNFNRNELICDSAEPKSIEELRLQGFNVHPAIKGADSIKIGIDILKRYDLMITKDSTNLIKELRGYTWDKDNTGKYTGKPIDTFNHALDALRYVALNKLNNRPSGKYSTIAI